MSTGKMNRREMLKRIGLAVAGTALAACAPQTVVVKEEVPVTQIVKETIKETIKETVIVAGTPKVVEKEVTKVVEKEVTQIVEKVITATPPPPEEIELRIGGWFDKGTQATVEKQIELFTDKFPHATVSIVVMPFEPEKNVVMLASGAGPDVFWVNNDQTAPWADRKALYTLDDLIAQDNLDMSDFFDIGKFLYSYEGHTYAITEYLGPLMLLVNPLLFEEAGVEFPPNDYTDPSWTLDSLLEKAKALTKRSGDGPAEQYGLYLSTSINRWFPIFWDFGGSIFDDWKAPTKVTFNSPETIAAIQWVVDLRLKHEVTSSAAEEQGMPMTAQFTTGKVAMLVEGPWYWPFFSVPEVLEKVPWEVYPMPRGPKGQFTRMAGDGYGMAAVTKHRDMAWELLKHVTIGEGAEVLWDPQLVKGIPPTRSMAADPRFLEHFSEASKKNAIELLEYSRGSPKHPNWYEVQGKLSPPLQEVFTGQRPIEEAVAESHNGMAEVWERVTAGP